MENSSHQPTRRDSGDMRAALTMDHQTSTFPPQIAATAEFVPRERATSARETKLISLYGKAGELFVSGDSTNKSAMGDLEPIAEYPLTKMMGAQTEHRRTRKSAGNEERSFWQ